MILIKSGKRNIVVILRWYITKNLIKIMLYSILKKVYNV